PGRARQIGPAAARNNCADCGSDFRGGNQSRSAAGARAEITDSQLLRVRLIGDPLACFDEPSCEQANVESQAPGHVVFALFLLREQVNQQRGDAGLADGARDKLVAGTVTAAAAS